MKQTLKRIIFLLALLAAFALGLQAEGQRRDDFVLVIDAGHGGHDPGAVACGAQEKTINLKVALAFGKLVEAGCPGVKVVYTRKRDVFIPLQRRADIANDCKADLFISIHTNALPKGRKAYGAETYTLGMHKAASNLEVAKRENAVITYETDYRTTYQGFDPGKAESYVIFELMQDRYMKQSVDLASYIQKAYRRSGRPDKGVHQAGFLVLRAVSMPSVLTELGFITTPSEAAFLTSADGINGMARSIYDGFAKYLKVHCRTLPAAEPQPAETPAATEENRAVEVVPVAATVPDVPEEAPAEAAPAEADAPRPTAGKPTAAPRKAAPKKAARENAAAAPKKAAPAAPRVVYRVQVGAGKKKVSTSDRQFKGLKVVCKKEGSLYKYFAGEFTTYSAARAALKRVQAKMPEAYLTACVDGKNTSVQEARKAER